MININNVSFKSRIKIQIRMTDIDILNHVNNGVIASYFDLGRLNYLKTVSGKIDLAKLDLVIVHTEFDYFASIRFTDNIAVDTTVVEFGNKSVKMAQRIIDVNTGKCFCSCISVLCGFDREKDCAIPIDENFKMNVLKFERDR